MSKVGASTKGWIKNVSTGSVKPFQFNPSQFEYSRSATYSDILAPGQSYPVTAFVNGGSREFSVELFFFDKPYSGVIDSEYLPFLESFMPPEVNKQGYTSPSDLIFCFGYFVRRCVMAGISVSVSEYDMNLNPTVAVVTLTLKQVGIQ